MHTLENDFLIDPLVLGVFDYKIISDLHGLVYRVHHPSLPSDPGHEIAKRQMGKGLYGSALAVLLASEAAAKALPASLRLFKDATSLGGVESLIEWRRKYDDKVDARLLRISIGLEHEADLCADLARAIPAVSGATQCDPAAKRLRSE